MIINEKNLKYYELGEICFSTYFTHWEFCVVKTFFFFFSALSIVPTSVANILSKNTLFIYCMNGYPCYQLAQNHGSYFFLTFLILSSYNMPLLAFVTFRFMVHFKNTKHSLKMWLKSLKELLL